MVVFLVSPQLVEWQLFEDISSYKCRFKENKFWQLYKERIFYKFVDNFRNNFKFDIYSKETYLLP